MTEPKKPLSDTLDAVLRFRPEDTALVVLRDLARRIAAAAAERFYKAFSFATERWGRSLDPMSKKIRCLCVHCAGVSVGYRPASMAKLSI
jgi:hypothetical protein